MEFLAGNIELENNVLINEMWDLIADNTLHLPGILGYKTPSLGKSIEETPSFILRSNEFGIIIIDLVNDNIVKFDEENEYWETSEGEEIFSRDIILDLFKQEIESKFKKNKNLFDIRKEEWKVDIKINRYIVFTQNSLEEINTLNNCDNPLLNKFYGADNYGEVLDEILTKTDKISQDKLDVIDSILDGSDIFSKTSKKKVEKDPENINEFIKLSLDNTFKLDSIQRQIALQIPSGPQRIRGLAGTGKTIILCMKAALAHKFFPEMDILFVFNTQSMYSQVESLITKYYFNETNKMPNWNKLHIFHAWGGSNKPGVYFNTANSIGIKPLNYMNVKNAEDPLQVIYADLLLNGKSKIIPKYDIVLIDEAQDFPSAFFETIFFITKYSDEDNKLKRIVWAYDEFQSLTEIKIKEPEELFGLTEGKPNIPNHYLEGFYKGKIQKDFVLPNSYRNPRINLMVAHGLALGLYSINSKMPMDSKRDWEARGYTVLEPNKLVFEENDKIEVERNSSVSKNNLEKLIRDKGREDRLVQFKTLADTKNQLDETILRVHYLIDTQKVEPEEIIIINLDTKNSKDQFEYIRQKLDIINIKCITPGYIESNDSFKVKGFITLTTPFRAKGNESNIVFILNSQKVVNDFTLRMRNAIFVSITRSRGWCYIYGQGDSNTILIEEITKIQNDYPFFKFDFPSTEDIKRKYSILKSKKDIEKADNDINTLFSDDSYRALLIEKLSQDPKLLQEIQNLKDKPNETK
ncbi:DEAD/DEAH box helicase [Flavobacterium johnsoniae]|uniref:Helicase/UvrB N-terminal domain-containing protein n=1 Tax=Flavobacterium johnsoniae TaxID=986 RepID=A0A1J7C4Q1_FLAJO|nr:ATP-binding domain-containing protein [Flavobacterium johnsoniae]OIV40665.1 hypothetical protein BKM63_17545 [Flavobacterium johnsoniae]